MAELEAMRELKRKPWQVEMELVGMFSHGKTTILSALVPLWKRKYCGQWFSLTRSRFAKSLVVAGIDKFG